jgi:hypothetical protein
LAAAAGDGALADGVLVLREEQGLWRGIRTADLGRLDPPVLTRVPGQADEPESPSLSRFLLETALRAMAMAGPIRAATAGLDAVALRHATGLLINLGFPRGLMAAALPALWGPAGALDLIAAVGDLGPDGAGLFVAGREPAVLREFMGACGCRWRSWHGLAWKE